MYVRTCIADNTIYAFAESEEISKLVHNRKERAILASLAAGWLFGKAADQVVGLAKGTDHLIELKC